MPIPTELLSETNLQKAVPGSVIGIALAQGAQWIDFVQKVPFAWAVSGHLYQLDRRCKPKRIKRVLLDEN